ncbi:MAG: hypothetical protein K6T92_04170 [Candidatus Rokubacteria bacterium]|nr:hypothetical protein [Candidatus Rokubacteria bacterium]
MSRFLEALQGGRVVRVVDGLLLCLGLTGTVAALAPVLLRVVALHRRMPPTVASRGEGR